MSRGISLLQDTFPAAFGAGIIAHRVVVMDETNHGNVKLPAATPELTVVGAAAETLSASGEALAVQLAGVATFQSDGSAVSNPGDYVVTSGVAGQVKTQTIAPPAAPGSSWPPARRRRR